MLEFNNNKKIGGGGKPFKGLPQHHFKVFKIIYFKLFSISNIAQSF